MTFWIILGIITLAFGYVGYGLCQLPLEYSPSLMGSNPEETMAIVLMAGAVI